MEGSWRFPARAAKYLVADRRVRAARHYVEVRASLDLVPDLAERQPIVKAVADSVRVLVFYKGAEGRDVADQIADDYASVLRFGESDAECHVGRGN